VRETREFERVTVKIRVSGQNRKQAFLEHEVYNDTGQLLGKGTQTLIFVDSKDYRLLDIPGRSHPGLHALPVNTKKRGRPNGINLRTFMGAHVFQRAGRGLESPRSVSS
jgi:hypothetical protein